MLAKGLGAISMLVMASACSPSLPEQTEEVVTTVADARPKMDRITRDRFVTSLYARATYDPAADPAIDLGQALERAKHEHKKVLLVIGGDWCSWCHVLDRHIHDNPEILQAFEATFVVVKVNQSEENDNEAFLGDYGEFDAVPHLIVLDSGGAVLASQTTVDWERRLFAIHNYAVEPTLAFARTWAAK